MKEADSDSRDSGVLSNPLSFIRSGYYAFDEGGLYARDHNGNFWGLHSINLTNSARLNIGDTNLYPIIGGIRGNGYAVRCVSILSLFNHFFEIII